MKMVNISTLLNSMHEISLIATIKILVRPFKYGNLRLLQTTDILNLM